MVKYSIAEENYVKAIYHLEQRNTSVSTNELSGVLQTSAASVTDMLKKLKKKKLITHKPYYGCNLTNLGQKLALLIIRRHRLWEFFLFEKLGFNWQEVHEVAEELEHVGSELLINKLDAFLKFPQFDPHGDPIPDSKGNFVQLDQQSLNLLPLHKEATVVQIAAQTAPLLEILEQKKITIGSSITVLSRSPFDNSVEIKINKKHAAFLSKELAQNILIKIS
ncbi:MAG: metal-dependent transcriptional regulator [Niabella sp.]